MKLEDQLILKLLFERSENAIKELSHKYSSLCQSISFNILGTKQDVDECINDALLAVWNSIPPERPASLQAYICKITRNLSLKKYSYNTATKRNNRYDAVLDELEECLSEGTTVEDGLIEKELTNEINSFLGTLKEKERVIFVKRYWFHESINEIAGHIGKTNNYVNVHLHRSREKLKAYLKKEGYEVE